MNPTTRPSRWLTIALRVIGAFAILNGVVMLLESVSWFGAVASDTGPINVHFVRDVGAAYCAAGVAVLWAAERPALRGALLTVASVFLGIHALAHVYEIATGALPVGHWVEDFPGVFLPAIVTTWAAVAALTGEPRALEQENA